MDHDTVRRCRFSTERLVVDEWHRAAGHRGLELVEVVSGILTAATTRELPPDWRGDFDRDRAGRWIESRDGESPTLLVVERRSGDPIGLLILYEARRGTADRSVDVRLGYVLAESSWGMGLASELVGGFVGWARSEPVIRSISGGVAPDHAASAWVLLKNDFVPTGDAGDTYRLEIR